MEQALPDDSRQPQVTEDDIKNYIHQRWHHNQHGSWFNAEKLDVTGEVHPEIPREKKGEWRGSVHFGVTYNLEVTVTHRHQPNKKTAMDKIETEVARANVASVPLQEEYTEREKRVG